MCIRKIVLYTNLSKSTVGNIKYCLWSERETELQRVMNAAVFSRAGRKTILTDEEELICNRLMFPAKCGFAIDINGIKSLTVRVAADGRRAWKSRMPSNDAVRSFRSRHREITFRNYESKENAKLKGENYLHVKSYFEILKDVGQLPVCC